MTSSKPGQRGAELSPAKGDLRFEMKPFGSHKIHKILFTDDYDNDVRDLLRDLGVSEYGRH
jgi:hypothetical protein